MKLGEKICEKIFINYPKLINHVLKMNALKKSHIHALIWESITIIRLIFQLMMLVQTEIGDIEMLM